MMKNKLNKDRCIKHIDVTKMDVTSMIDQMEHMSFQARNLARGAKILEMMNNDHDCVNILTLAGSLISAGLKNVIVDMIKLNMIDVIVSTGANIVDQDFFEALGFKHYIGSEFANDSELRKQHIDRIYDTYIDEDELRICDDTIKEIADSLEPRPYSSREFIVEMGKYFDKYESYESKNSIIYNCYKKGIPIFVPAFSDCSAGFGLVAHQWQSQKEYDKKKSSPLCGMYSRFSEIPFHVTIDSAKDFREITKIKLQYPTTGIFMIGGGVPKNFVQDIVVAAEVVNDTVESHKYGDINMHKYAIQITVADSRDGALSGSTLKEASSWGKVDTTYEQMIFSEATIAMPIIVAYSVNTKAYDGRQEKRLNEIF